MMYMDLWSLQFMLGFILPCFCISIIEIWCLNFVMSSNICLWFVLCYILQSYTCTCQTVETNHHMMTSSNGNTFCVTGPLCGESTGHRWIPHAKVSGAELWCFFLFAPEQTAEQTIEMPMIWDFIGLIMTSLWWINFKLYIPILNDIWIYSIKAFHTRGTTTSSLL